MTSDSRLFVFFAFLSFAESFVVEQQTKERTPAGGIRASQGTFSSIIKDYRVRSVVTTVLLGQFQLNTSTVVITTELYALL